MNLNQMMRIAKNSDHKLYNHCALILSGNRLLSYGYNSGTLHAEESAIRRLDRLYRTNNSRKPRNLHLISFMIKRKTGFFGSSYPCPDCWNIIEKNHIRTVTYFYKGNWVSTNNTSDVGWFGRVI